MASELGLEFGMAPRRPVDLRPIFGGSVMVGLIRGRCRVGGGGEGELELLSRFASGFACIASDERSDAEREREASADTGGTRSPLVSVNTPAGDGLLDVAGS